MPIWFPSILTLAICVLIVLLLASGEEIDFSSGLYETTDVERALWLELGKEHLSPFTDDDLATVRRLHVKRAWPGRVSEDYDLMLLARCINLIELKLPTRGSMRHQNMCFFTDYYQTSAQAVARQ